MNGPGGLFTALGQRILQRGRSQLPLSPVANTTQTARRPSSVSDGRMRHDIAATRCSQEVLGLVG